MDPVIIFRHIDCEGPGYLAEVLNRHHVPTELIAIDAGDPVPESPRAAGLVFMGGPMSVNDDVPWIGQELALIRRAVEAGVPVLGHCLGGQLIARALGAGVGANPVKEIGWHRVTVVDDGGAGSWLDGIPGAFPAFHWHGETFALPEGAVRLFESAHCAHQGFTIGTRVLALQFHLEMTAELVRDWVARYSPELVESADSPGVQTAEDILDHLEDRIGGLQRVADTLYGRWLEALAR